MYANSYTDMCRMHLYILNTFQTWCPASRRENSQVSLQRKGFLSIAQSIAQHRALSLGPSNRGGHCMVVEYVPFSEVQCVLLLNTCVKGASPLFTTAHYHIAESKSTNMVQKPTVCGFPRWIDGSTLNADSRLQFFFGASTTSTTSTFPSLAWRKRMEKPQL